MIERFEELYDVVNKALVEIENNFHIESISRTSLQKIIRALSPMKAAIVFLGKKL